jgi:hypothetical protein
MKEDIKQILEESGWYYGRRIEIDYMIEELAREELTIPNRLIEELLHEFWNLLLNFRMPDGASGEIRLNTEIGLGVEQATLTKFEKAVGEKMVPVGGVNECAGILFVSYSGRFYMHADAVFWYVAHNFFEALDVIIHQKEFKIILTRIVP